MESNKRNGNFAASSVEMIFKCQGLKKLDNGNGCRQGYHRLMVLMMCDDGCHGSPEMLVM